MAVKKEFRLTQTGVAELRAELTRLIAKRSDIAESIRSARELGDLAENAEYQSARAEHERNELRIMEIEHILQNAKLISTPKSEDKVLLGSKVMLKSTNGKSKEFQVVGTVEADPLNGKISDESPIGKQLLNKRIGEEIEIKTPAETTIYTIAAIG